MTKGMMGRLALLGAVLLVGCSVEARIESRPNGLTDQQKDDSLAACAARGMMAVAWGEGIGKDGWSVQCSRLEVRQPPHVVVTP